MKIVALLTSSLHLPCCSLLNPFSPPPAPVISHLDYCSMFRSLVSPFSPLPAPWQSVLNTAAQRCSTPGNLYSEHAAGSHLIHGETQSPCSSLYSLYSLPPLLPSLPSYYSSSSLNSSHVDLRHTPVTSHSYSGASAFVILSSQNAFLL